MKQRLIALLLVLCLGAALVPVVSAADDSENIDRNAIIESAVYFFSGYEGTYTSVYRKDSNAVSIGRLQWHGVRAHSLLARIVAKNPAKMRALLSTSLYNEIVSDVNWSTRSVTAEEAAQIVLVLGTPEGILAQDEQATIDIGTYIDHALKLGIRSNAAILYYCTIENQYGYGGAINVMKTVRSETGLGATITSLETFHQCVLITTASSVQNYISYRKSTYKYISTLGWNMNGVDETTAASHPSSKFIDVPATAWFRGAVDYAVTHTLFSGTSDCTFSPELTMSRAMMVTVLYRMAGTPAVSGSSGFSDVPDGQWYTNPVTWAVKKGLIAGVGNGRFDPNGVITREQIALILYKYTKMVRYTPTVTNTSLCGFADGDLVSEYAKTAMLWAVQQGLMKGSPSGGEYYLNAGMGATRAELAQILMCFTRAYYR